MSKYFQALNRISQQSNPPQQAEPKQARDQKTDAVQKTQPRDTLLHVSPFAEIPLAKRQRAYSELLDSLRSLPDGAYGVPCMVMAGVSRRISATNVMTELRHQSQEQGLRLLSLEVITDGSQRYLREAFSDGVEERADSYSTALSDRESRDPREQRSRSAGSQLEQWLQEVDEHFDLLVIQAPPLTESVEAAIVARETDGLILVVENLVDSHADLEAAVEKARDANCNLFGVVLLGAREWLPKWLRRLFKGRST